MSQFKKMSDEYLRKTYVPDIYQKSIFNIDYDRLKNAGIKLISFDIDDTIESIAASKSSKESITLFEKLRLKGFELCIISNANFDRVEHFGDILKVKAVHRAEKPYVKGFIEVQKNYQEKYGYKIEPNEMAHIGNSMINDIAGGNVFGVTTCLVRNVGIFPKTGKILNPFKTKGQELREVLLERGIWRKHHLESKEDQYYQLNETQIKFDAKK